MKNAAAPGKRDSDTSAGKTITSASGCNPIRSDPRDERSQTELFFPISRALIAEFIATLHFLYITVATGIGHKKQQDACNGVGPLGIRRHDIHPR
ncbi:hypothetical protein V6N13_018384 [Hibiscus sabdariffa]|uniref:Uncharacterized protein n=2 Tax=Hibiscus sabdariffa TaxID=183260 RepID=A0ABR2EMI7_9ROSI